MFPLLSTLSMINKISGKSVHLAQKSHFYQNATNKESWCFVKSNFHLNQTCKIVLTQNHEIWNFTATESLDIFIKDRRKVFGW